ncbi:hypothetical protein EDD18DRAFT_684950 [Armillaria luteobubalina]|uniref:Uncharacterized protein n=1 Tax=Armillaria luteobubalina TaxID=153913 RepID=A0AA39QG33_9AGAR|nr:hypothetical protein EDD18DRAFT_684950 [Armillaria luteobubalina]
MWIWTLTRLFRTFFTDCLLFLLSLLSFPIQPMGTPQKIFFLLKMFRKPNPIGSRTISSRRLKVSVSADIMTASYPPSSLHKTKRGYLVTNIVVTSNRPGRRPCSAIPVDLPRVLRLML